MAGTSLFTQTVSATSPQYVYLSYSGTYSGLGYGDSGVLVRVYDNGELIKEHSAAVSAVRATYSGSHNLGSGNHIVWIDLFNGTSNDFDGSMTVKGSAAPTLSASTFTAADVNFGAVSKVSISNSNISSVKHLVSWTVGTKYATKNVAAGVSSVEYTIPTSWMSEVPNSTSGTLTVAVKTMNSSGTQIGSVASQTYKVNVPTSVIPSIGSLTPSIYNPVSGFNTYIQGMTGAKITINNPKAGDGATIKSYDITPNQDTSLKDLVYTVSKLSNSGSIKFTVTIKDSRGRTASKDVTINVTPYAKPNISQMVVYRCDANGNEDSAGTYARVMCVATKSDISGNNLYINTQYYKEVSPNTKYTGENSMESGVYYLIGGNMDPNSTYIVQYTVYDSICGVSNAVTLSGRVETSPYSIHIKNGGNGVAFGKTSERDDSVEIKSTWDLYYKGKPIDQLIRDICRDVIRNG